MSDPTHRPPSRFTRPSWPPKGRARRALLALSALTAAAGTIMVVAVSAAAASPRADASNDPTGTVSWTGNGSNTIVTCQPGQSITYHWILSPGGATLQSATLDVTYNDGAAPTVGAVGTQNGNGAIQWFITVTPYDTPKTAVATVSFTGATDTSNMVLTISGTECTAGSSSPPTSPPPSSGGSSSTPPPPPSSSGGGTTPPPPPSASAASSGVVVSSSSAAGAVVGGQAQGPIPAGANAGLNLPNPHAALRTWGIVLMILGGLAGLLTGVWPTRRRAH